MKTQVPASKTDNRVGARSHSSQASHTSPSIVSDTLYKDNLEEPILHPSEYNLANLSINPKVLKISQLKSHHGLTNRLSNPSFSSNHFDPSNEFQSNKTGLPDQLKAGIENLSGMLMNDVKVHYNSTKPDNFQALAYTQGTDIYLGSGQERHLPHEAWHVVQQKQGRVKPSLLINDVAINNDPNLENEANGIGKTVLRQRSDKTMQRQGNDEGKKTKSVIKPIMQRVLRVGIPGEEKEEKKIKWYKNREEIADVAFEKMGISANSFRALAAMAESNQTIYKFGYWDKKIPPDEAVYDIPDRVSAMEFAEKSGELQLRLYYEEENRGKEFRWNKEGREIKGGEDIPREEKIPIEKETQYGFEMETSGHFKVVGEKVKEINSVINKTLAENDNLEFLIDDFDKNTRMVQIEFRTKPLNQNTLLKSNDITLNEITKRINKAIWEFPMGAFSKGSDPKVALEEKGWTTTTAFNKVGHLLRKVENSLTPKQIQHVTHSIPLAAFAAMDGRYKELLIPGTKGITTVKELIEFFIRKIVNTQGVVKDIQTNERIKKVQKSKSKYIHVTTHNRTAVTPNIKTSIDTLVGMMDNMLDRMDLIIKMENTGIKEVPVGNGKSAPIKTVDREFGPGTFPSYNTGSAGEGYFSVEEKLKPPMLDNTKRDIRVLVEHRQGPLVDAIRKAAAGDYADIDKYKQAFAKLDKVQGDKVFEAWFQ